MCNELERERVTREMHNVLMSQGKRDREEQDRRNV